jgi:hypothetical protein
MAGALTAINANANSDTSVLLSDLSKQLEPMRAR